MPHAAAAAAAALASPVSAGTLHAPCSRQPHARCHLSSTPLSPPPHCLSSPPSSCCFAQRAAAAPAAARRRPATPSLPASVDPPALPLTGCPGRCPGGASLLCQVQCEHCDLHSPPHLWLDTRPLLHHGRPGRRYRPGSSSSPCMPIHPQSLHPLLGSR